MQTDPNDVNSISLQMNFHWEQRKLAYRKIDLYEDKWLSGFLHLQVTLHPSQAAPLCKLHLTAPSHNAVSLFGIPHSPDDKHSILSKTQEFLWFFSEPYAQEIYNTLLLKTHHVTVPFCHENLQISCRQIQIATEYGGICSHQFCLQISNQWHLSKLLQQCWPTHNPNIWVSWPAVWGDAVLKTKRNCLAIAA